MQTLDLMFQLPADLEMWIVLCYVIAVLIGARVTELLARMHFNFAHRQAEQGFEYVVDEDHYRCPEGERLSRTGVEPSHGLAIYEAAPDRCRTCTAKSECVPQGTSRRLYRSLVSWAQTDTGRFHRRVSMLMFGAAAVLALVGTWQWSGSPGTGYLVISLVDSSISLAWDMPRFRTRSRRGD
jgi:hypothetical protein